MNLRSLLKPFVEKESRMSRFNSVPYRYTDADADYVREIVASGKLHHGKGKEAIFLESEFASYIRSSYAVSTNSGTSALVLACNALGLGPGDEVIIPAYTFIATAQAVLQCGAIPVFADIDDTHTISPRSIEKHITTRTKAIIVVHTFGNVCDMNAISSIAKKKNIHVIEDCAQAAGATYYGVPVGAIGDIGCFSFNILKAIPVGQGGIITTSEKTLYQRAIAYRNTGIVNNRGRIDVESYGSTLFLPEIEAALARRILRQLEYLNGLRRKNVHYLLELLHPYVSYLQPYKVNQHALPSYSRMSFLFAIDRSKLSRDKFIKKVNVAGVPLRTFYPAPLYTYSIFVQKKNILTGQEFPFTSRRSPQYVKLPYAERFSRAHVGLEISPYWDFDDIKRMSKEIIRVIELAIK